MIETNPTVLIDVPKIHDKSIIRLDTDEVALLLDYIEHCGDQLTGQKRVYYEKNKERDLAIVTLLLGTGIRVSECVGLDIEDVDFKNNGIKVTRKGGNEQEEGDVYRYMMVGYRLENTLTENGHVARGVCVTDEEGHLIKINERTHIEKHDGGTAYTEDDGKTWTMLPEGSIVSMNMWGFSNSILKELKERFKPFLDDAIKNNPMKGEYFLPFVVDELLQEHKATVKVLKSEDKWYGVTYKEDKPMVMAAVQNLKDQGLYPQNLWEEA